MEISTFALPILGILIATVFLFRLSAQRHKSYTSRVNSHKKHAPAAASEHKEKQYHGVAIECGAESCNAAKAIENQRFLLADIDIFQIPVHDCNVANCRCKYVHYEDRRQEDTDRRMVAGLKSELFQHDGHVEQRHSRGRRSGDWGVDSAFA